MEYIREDGTKVIERRVPQHLRGMPTYGDWLRKLLAVNAAKVTRTKCRICGGKLVRCEDCDSTGYEVDVKGIHHTIGKFNSAGRAVAPCLCCGKDTALDELSRVTIGGFIRVRTEEATDVDEVTISYRRQIVVKSGDGCKVCAGLMFKAVCAANETNKEREELNRKAVAQSKLLQDLLKKFRREGRIDNATFDEGIKKTVIKTMNPVTAFIDVLDESGDVGFQEVHHA